MTRTVKRRSSLKLYWVETADHHEDWFVIARTARDARRFFEETEGYDSGDATSRLVGHLPEELQSEVGNWWTAREVGPFTSPCWPSEAHLKACGGVYLMKDDTRVVLLGGRAYAEGLLEREVRTGLRGFVRGRAPPV